MSKNHTIAIVGGGAGGLGVAHALLNARPDLDIAIIEPSEKHYYQPGWTLVGGGEMAAATTERSMADYMPIKATWIRDRVSEFQASQNQLVLSSGDVISYQYLIVATGLTIDWQKIDGLEATLGKNGVCSNYRFDLAPYTWECVRILSTGGKALFTQPPMPIKCAGAPQKILYLAADYWRRNNKKADISFCNQGGAMFGVPYYAKALDKIMDSYDAKRCFGENLTAIDGDAKVATFTKADGEVVRREFDMIHVVPPQSAPQEIQQSELAGDGGWMAVDQHTMQSAKFENTWGLGDCTSTPNAKTAAAVRKQYPVVAARVLAAIDGKTVDGSQTYDGYGGCPLTTAKGKMLMAEFRYGGEVLSSFGLDPAKERSLYWPIKTKLFPWIYWNVILKGKDWKKPEAKPWKTE
jgi:sulfide:quinone oxidoreductase